MITVNEYLIYYIKKIYKHAKLHITSIVYASALRLRPLFATPFVSTVRLSAFFGRKNVLKHSFFVF
jgi:hypothetical protein